MSKFGYWRNTRPLEGTEAGSLWASIRPHTMELVDEDMHLWLYAAKEDFRPAEKPELPPSLLGTHYLRWLDEAMEYASQLGNERAVSSFADEFSRTQELKRSGMDTTSLSEALWESIGKMNQLYDNLNSAAQ